MSLRGSFGERASASEPKELSEAIDRSGSFGERAKASEPKELSGAIDPEIEMIRRDDFPNGDRAQARNA